MKMLKQKYVVIVSVEASYEVSETEKNDLLMRYNHLREDVAKALFISNMHELVLYLLSSFFF